MYRSNEPESNSRYYSRQRSSFASPKKPLYRRIGPRAYVFIGIAIVSIFALNVRLIHADEKPAAPTYSKKETVCIDPGHGGVDPGALSTDGSISERDINLTVAMKVKSLLNASGYQVFMTRTTNDVTMNNNDRYTYCNDKHATILVSIHHNFFDDSTVNYVTDLYYKSVDKGLATSIASATATKLDLSNNGIAQFEDGVLSKSTMPAAVSEGFFITNDDELALMTAKNSTRLSDEASGIATGIETYLADPATANANVSADAAVLERSDD